MQIRPCYEYATEVHQVYRIYVILLRAKNQLNSIRAFSRIAQSVWDECPDGYMPIYSEQHSNGGSSQEHIYSLIDQMGMMCTFLTGSKTLEETLDGSGYVASSLQQYSDVLLGVPEAHFIQLCQLCLKTDLRGLTGDGR